MGNRSLLILCCLLALSTPSSGEEFLLYTPKPAAGDQKPPAPDQGVLVKTVTVKRGDTLAKLSRKHIGVASWFPQVLVFNTIRNPDLIHPGDKLLMPVRAGQLTSKQRVAKSKKHHLSRTRRPSLRPKPVAAPAPLKMQVAVPGERESFQRAQRAYLDRDYQKALEQFSSFLGRFPQSKFAAEASLYRADCFMRLSGE